MLQEIFDPEEIAAIGGLKRGRNRPAPGTGRFLKVIFDSSVHI
jgi:hypothetical protein